MGQNDRTVSIDRLELRLTFEDGRTAKVHVAFKESVLASTVPVTVVEDPESSVLVEPFWIGTEVEVAGHKMTEETLESLQHGDVVRHRTTGESYVVLHKTFEAGRTQVVASRTITVSNPPEWVLVKKHNWKEDCL